MLKFPKPIIRRILSYIDVITFAINPVQMLILIGIGIDIEAKEYRQIIWQQYYDQIVADSEIIKHSFLLKPTWNEFKNIVQNIVENYARLHHIDIEGYDHKGEYYHGPHKIDKFRTYVYNKLGNWIKIFYKPHEILVKEVVTKLNTQDVKYLELYIYGICLGDYDENYRQRGENERCQGCNNKLVKGKCKNVSKIKYKTIVISSYPREENMNVTKFLAYIRSLMKLKQFKK
jgi:hypothetical protein